MFIRKYTYRNDTTIRDEDQIRIVEDVKHPSLRCHDVNPSPQPCVGEQMNVKRISRESREEDSKRY